MKPLTLFAHEIRRLLSTAIHAALDRAEEEGL